MDDEDYAYQGLQEPLYRYMDRLSVHYLSICLSCKSNYCYRKVLRLLYRKVVFPF
jgi:hypothetical protein